MSKQKWINLVSVYSIIYTVVTIYVCNRRLRTDEKILKIAEGCPCLQE